MWWCVEVTALHIWSTLALLLQCVDGCKPYGRYIIIHHLLFSEIIPCKLATTYISRGKFYSSCITNVWLVISFQMVLVCSSTKIPSFFPPFFSSHVFFYCFFRCLESRHKALMRFSIFTWGVDWTVWRCCWPQIPVASMPFLFESQKWHGC